MIGAELAVWQASRGADGWIQACAGLAPAPPHSALATNTGQTAGNTRQLGTRPPSLRRAVQGVHSVAYSPLGHRKDNELMTHPAVLEVAAEAGKSPAQVGLAGWRLAWLAGWPAGWITG